MATREKGKSPFHPGQPVPPELFVGRQAQIDKILTRGCRQVAAGKPIAMFVQGEYGIGKSSIASYSQRLAEREHGLLRIYANLGGAHDLTGLATQVIEATIRSGGFAPNKMEKVRNWLSKYIGKQELFGISINLEALRTDAPNFTTPSQMLSFLREVLMKVQDAGIRGIFLVLDELNGIVDAPAFAHFIKGLIEENAISESPLPLLLMLCGVEDKRRTMIKYHPPVDRIFDIIEIEKMSDKEMEEFFSKSFSSAEMSVTEEAMRTLIHYSAGFPKVMHVIGDEAYFVDSDWIVDEEDALLSVLQASDEIGRKFVDQQVYKALRSPDYRSILEKIASHGPSTTTFAKKAIAQGLTPAEKKKLDNFLQRMKKLNVIRAGDSAGEYIFNIQMVRIYIWLKSQKQKNSPPDSEPKDVPTTAGT